MDDCNEGDSQDEALGPGISTEQNNSLGTGLPKMDLFFVASYVMTDYFKF